MVILIADRAVIRLVAEFLDLTRKSYLYRIVVIYLLHDGFKHGILVRGKRALVRKVYSKLLCRHKGVVVIEVSEGLRVSSSFRVVPHAVDVHLGGVAMRYKIVTAFILFNALGDISCGARKYLIEIL